MTPWRPRRPGNHATGPARPSPEVEAKAIERWSDQELLADAFGPAVYWLAHPDVAARVASLATGGSHLPWTQWVATEHLAACRTVMSIGCGTGAFERDLRQAGYSGRIIGVDPAAVAVDVARDAAVGLDIEYRVGTLASTTGPGDGVDAVVWRAALHHSPDVAADLDRSCELVGPGGLVILDEYVGADRFAFGPAQRHLIAACWNLLPDAMRVSHQAVNRGEVLVAPPLPDPAEVAAVDPSEAVQSSRIVPAFTDRVDVVAWHPYGGQLLQFLLAGTCGNYVGEAGSAWLRVLFAIEDAAEADGRCPSDFVSAVGRVTPR